MNISPAVSLCISFKHWKRKRYAVFCTLHKVVRIGVLSVAYFLLTFGVKAQTITVTDTIRIPDQEIEEVVVSSGRTPVTAQQVARVVTVITKAEIERAPAQSLNDLLRFVSSIDIRQRGPLGAQADISIRGGTYDQTLILLNGINISDPQTGHHNLNLPVTPESIERIEILRGPAAKTFGPNAFNGAVNIITGNRNPHQLKVSASAGQFGLLNGSMGISLGHRNFSHFVNAGHLSSNGYISNTDFNQNTLFYQAALKTKSGSAGLQAGYSARDFGANSFYSLKYPDQFEAVNTSFMSLKFEHNSRIRFSSAAYLRQNRDRFELIRNDESKVPFNHHKTSIFGINMIAGLTIRQHKISLGTDIRNEHILSTLLGNPVFSPVNVRGFKNAFYTRSYNRLNTSLYAEHLYSGKRISLQLGMLAHHNQGLERFRFYHGADLNYRIRNYHSVFIAYNRTLRMPTFTDMFYKSPVQSGNPYLKPEEASTLEGGWKYNNTILKAFATAFTRKGNNLIDWVKDSSPDSLVWRSMNHTRINQKGVELSFTITPSPESRFNRIVSAGISYTFLDAVSGHGQLLSKYALDYLRQQITSSVNFRIAGKWVGLINLTWRDRNGNFQDVSGKIQSYRPFWLLDARISRKSGIITVFSDIANILDTQYYDYGGILQPGMWIRAGLTVDIGI
jgi:iron complex outermembrane receptor protein